MHEHRGADSQGDGAQPPDEESKMELQTRMQILAIAMSFGFVAAVILGMV